LNFTIEAIDFERIADYFRRLFGCDNTMWQQHQDNCFSNFQFEQELALARVVAETLQSSWASIPFSTPILEGEKGFAVEISPFQKCEVPCCTEYHHKHFCKVCFV
jgi:hypothetical protein